MFAFMAAPIAIGLFAYAVYREVDFQQAQRQAEHEWDEGIAKIKGELEEKKHEGDIKDEKTRDINRRHDGRRRHRERKKQRRKEIEDEKEKRKGYYYGCVDRIEQLDADRGWEIRLDAIEENALSDDVFLQEVQKLVIAASPLGVAGSPMHIISIYFKELPPKLAVGEWVNFKLDKSKAKRCNKTEPDLSGSIEDGTTILEKLEPSISFPRQSVLYYLESDYGSLITAEKSSFTVDIAASAISLLKTAFAAAGGVQSHIKHGLQLVMDTKPSATNTVDRVKTILTASSKEATVVEVLNVSQGASAVIRSGSAKMFASDFGYGRGEIEPEDVCVALIYGNKSLPILLSHWDSDHYRIAISPSARALADRGIDCRARTWIAPSNMTGIVAPALAQSIDELVTWPTGTTIITSGNVSVLECAHKSGNAYPDKNNFGALALVVGSGSNRLLYPATPTSSVSPASTNWMANLSGSVCFSYGAKNAFGHDMKRVFKYYEKKGFTNGGATAALGGDADTIEITVNLDARWSLAQSQNYNKTQVTATETSSLTPVAAQNNSRQGVDFEELVTLSGSDKKDITQDDLSEYAVRDSFGDVSMYNVIATKLVLRNLPLCVPCSTDFPVEVRMQCDDIEIQSSETTAPLLRFNVAGGPEWASTGNPGEAGRDGEPGFVGGYLRLSVAGNWLVKLAGGETAFWSKGFESKPDQSLRLSVQYRGGRGSNGQKGGHGVNGVQGTGSTDDEVVYRAGGVALTSWLNPGTRAGSGTDGGQGGKGGSAGKPGAFSQSFLTATKGQIPAGDRMSFDLDLGTSDDKFGAPASGGEGGDKGEAGEGGIEGKRYISKRKCFGKDWALDESAPKQASKGAEGTPGQAGDGPPSVDPVEQMKKDMAPSVKTADTRVALLATMSTR
ncbi:hypothetical protein OQA88_11543 [Cercophora sp. LCS_1]